MLLLMFLLFGLANVFSIISCALYTPPTYNEIIKHPLYKYVRQENMDKIMAGQVEIGMNGPECMIAWNCCHFEMVHKTEDRNGFYDIYKVTHPNKRVYLHFRNLILINISEYPYH